MFEIDTYRVLPLLNFFSNSGVLCPDYDGRRGWRTFHFVGASLMLEISGFDHSAPKVESWQGTLLGHPIR
jgi:hypothetical protein